MTRLAKLAVFMLTALVGTGCVNLKTAPGYARAGDMVSVAVGGLKFNTNGAQTIQPGDITATLTDSGSVPHNVKVLATFRAYPDFTSLYSVGSLDRSGAYGGFYSDVEPYDGQWWVNMQLVDPLTDNPLPLALGNATLALSISGVTDTYGSDGNLNNLSLEIVAGTATPDPLDFAQYVAYSPQRSLTVQPDTLAGVPVVGGMQVKLDYNNAAVKPGSPLIPRLVPVTHDPNINIIQHTVDNGDGTSSLIAMVTNPNGFVPDSANGGSWSIGRSTFKDLNFSIVVQDDNDLAGYTANYALDAVESYYIDDNGNVIGAATPILGLNF